MAHVAPLDTLVTLQFGEIAAKGVVLLLGLIGVRPLGDEYAPAAIVEPVVVVAVETVAPPVAGEAEVVRPLADRTDVQVIPLITPHADALLIVEIAALRLDSKTRSLLQKVLEGASSAHRATLLKAIRDYLMPPRCGSACEDALDEVAADIDLVERAAKLEDVFQGIFVIDPPENVDQRAAGVAGVRCTQESNIVHYVRLPSQLRTDRLETCKSWLIC